MRSSDAVASAGSVYSSVSDMAKWMRFMLDSGRVGTKRLISPATFRELITPQIRVPMDQYPALALAKPDFFSYGFGWFIQDYQGRHMWMHTGSINGMCAIIGLLPNERLGVYILENLDHAEIRHGLMYAALDLYSNGPSRDWNTDLKPIFARPVAAGAPAAAPRAVTPPSLSLERYAGVYADSAYGDVRVTFDNGSLSAAVVTEPAAPLRAVTFDAFRTQPADSTRATTIVFVPDGTGGVSAVRISGITFFRVRR
jgi:CubicO group peptidase (beta-lactamase class C family)